MKKTDSEKMTPSKNETPLKKDKDLDKDQLLLFKDPDYEELLNLYQSAKFDECEDLVLKLLQKYPDSKELEKFKNDLSLKLTFKDSIDSVTREEKKTKRKKIFKISVYSFFTTIIVVCIFFFISFLIQINRDTKQLEQDYYLLSSLEDQVEGLLESGKPQQAAEIVEQMKLVNADYENLPVLISETEALLNMEADYQKALDLITQGQEAEALEMLQAIENEEPGIWDVRNQIALIEKNQEIKTMIDEGNRAFNIQDWDSVITAYEKIQDIDPNRADFAIKEQLIQAYLNHIVEMLDDPGATIEDIENAENNYRKAIALVSQSKAFASERENLENVSNELLQVKYRQIAKAALQDKSQTSSSVSEAINYLRKAVDLDPENEALGEYLQNAEYYQIAFRNFQDSKWDEAVSNLKLVLSEDPIFADGNANILLFEAYYALSKEYYSVGLYLDAIQALEQAEIIVFSDTDNLLRLFQVQTFLGRTLGKVNNIQDAVSYYKYAFDAIDASTRLSDFPELNEKLTEANIETTYFNFDNAFLLYEELYEEIDVIYAKPEVVVEDGVCLAFVAGEYKSTLESIIEANNLPSSMTVLFGRTLIVPTIEN